MKHVDKSQPNQARGQKKPKGSSGKKKQPLEKSKLQGLTDQASEVKFRRLFESARDGILLLDAGTGEIMDANPFIEAILGYARKELIGKKIWEIGEFKDITANQAAVTKLQKKRYTRFGDLPIVTKDGQRRNVEFISSVYRVGRQKVIQCNFRDITESTLAVNSLAESEERYRDFFDNASLGIFKTSADGRIIAVNPAFARMFGYGSPEEVKSLVRNAADLFADPRRRTEIIRLQAEHPDLTSFENLYRRKDGSTFFGNLTVRKSTGRGGLEDLFEGFIEDVSERMRAERALRESELKSRIIFENSSAGVALVGLDGKYLMVNPAFCEIHGYSAEELLKMNFYQVTHPDDIDLSRKAAQEVVRGGSKNTNFYKRYIHKDGHTIWAEVSSSLVNGIDGKPEYFITHVIDITERRRAEEIQTMRMEQLVAINQVSQTVASSLDLNQVLTKIVELAGKVGGSDYISIVLVDENGRISSSTEAIPDTLSLQQRVRKRGLTNWIIRTHEPVIVDEVDEEGMIRPRIGKGAPHTVNPDLVAKGIKSFIGLPLMVENHVEGVAYLHSLRTGTYHDQMTLLTTLANQAAIAIQKARLYEQAQRELAERKRAEEALANERNLLRSLIDNVPDFIYVKDTEARFVLVNMACVRGAGYSKPEEALGKTDFDYYSHELAARYFADDQKVLQTGQPLLQHEEPSVDAKGKQLWLSTNKVPLRDAQGKIYGLVGTGRDITGAKQAEAELEASREAERNFSERLTILSEITTELSKAEDIDTLCRSAVELGRERLDFDRLSIFFLSEDSNAILGTFGVDSEGRVTDERGDRYPVNPESHMWSILHSKVPLLQVTETPLYMRGQVVGQGKHVFAGLWDGEKVIGSITLDNLRRQRPFSDRDCEIIRLFASAVGHLVSLKRTQEGLRASEERFAKSFQVNPLPVCISAFPDGQMVEANEAFMRLTEYTHEELINHSGPELNLWADPKIRATLSRELLENGSVRDIEGRLRTKAGHLRDILASAEIIQLSGQPHALIMLSDITERKQAQVLQEAVYRIAAATETTSSLDELYPQIHQIISSVMPAENFYIALYDEAEDLLRFSYFRDAADAPFMGGIQPGKGLTAFVLRTGKSLLCTQAVHDELERRGEVKLLGVPSAIWLGVPLIVDGKTMGAMVVQHYTDPKAYGEREQNVLEFVSTQVAIAINRKRAEAELQASRESERNFAERLTILSEVTTELSKAENLDILCRRGVELGRERLDFDRLSIWFLSEDHTFMLGTFGVDTEGRYTDEREQQFPIGPDFPNWQVIQGQVPLLRLTDTALSLNGQVVGQGMHVSAGLWDGKNVIGYLSLDNLLRRRPFSDQDCEIIRLFASAVGHLISLKRAQEGLLASEERYRMLFELSPDSIAVHQDGKVIITNPSAVKLLGASSPEQIIGKSVMDLVHPDYHQIVLERTRQQMIKGKTVPVLEEKFLRLDGSAIDVDVTAAPVTHRNRPASMVIFRDISERKQVAEALERQSDELNQRNEELARLYRASGSLLSGASSSLQELAETILGVVQKEFGQANCSLLVVQHDSNELQRLATAGPYAGQVKEKVLSMDGPGLVPHAIRTGKTVNVGDVRSNSEHLSNWEAARSEMTIPLKIGSEVIGVIDVQSSEPNAFSQNDERLMTVFGERAALALEQSRLYEQAAIRVQQLAALRTVDMAISSSFDINLTLGILLDQLSAQLGIHAADILVYDPVTQTFRFSCGRGFRTNTLEHTHLRLGEGFAGRAALERQLIKVSDVRTEPSRSGKFLLPLGENFVGYVGVPLIAKGQIKGVLEVFQREPLELNLDQQAFLEMLAGQAGIAIDNASLFEHQQRAFADLNDAYDETLEGWASALELRDKETEGHTRRVTDQTIRLAQAMGVKKDDLVHIYRGALLHDIGKIGIPDGIVLKPGPLTEDERKTMHMHPNYAYKMLSPISYLREAVNIPYCHHEKWNGTGYPRGLKGLEIPLAARIFSVVDVWDALTSDRPYRQAWTVEKARQYIREQAGLHFDPEVVEAFLNSGFMLE